MKQNFLLIQVDQLAARALKTFGGEADTPHIDALFNHGAAFENCTVQCPLCQPSRTSMWSSLYPFETKVLSNSTEWNTKRVSPEIQTLGELFQKNHYKTIHFGKDHAAGTLKGFEMVEQGIQKGEKEKPYFPLNKDSYHDIMATEKASEFLKSYSFSQPLMMVVDLINPHNICGFIGENKGFHQQRVPGVLPELPPNFEIKDLANRAQSIQYLCCSHRRQAQTVGWSKTNFREYIAAYYYYLHLVDTQIGTILTSLDQTGQRDNTTIVFFSDHGDFMGCRGAVTKQVALYEETVHVPLVFCGKSIPSSAQKIQGLAESLDIVPTLCDLAGIPIPPEMRGISLVNNLLTGEKVQRAYAVSQWHTEWYFTVSPSRMIKTEHYKYIHYLEDNFEEMYDLVRDPYEMENIAQKSEYKTVLDDLRTKFKEYLLTTGDTYLTLENKVDKRCRNHPLGYQNHHGLCAADAFCG